VPAVAIAFSIGLVPGRVALVSTNDTGWGNGDGSIS
jgi:hypothetical protein